MKQKTSNLGDKIFKTTTMVFAIFVFALVFLMANEMITGSDLSLKKFGRKFLTTSTWDSVAEIYGALPYIFGTVFSSLFALVLAVPLSL